MYPARLLLSEYVSGRNAPSISYGDPRQPSPIFRLADRPGDLSNPSPSSRVHIADYGTVGGQIPSVIFLDANVPLSYAVAAHSLRYPGEHSPNNDKPSASRGFTNFVTYARDHGTATD